MIFFIALMIVVLVSVIVCAVKWEEVIFWCLFILELVLAIVFCSCLANRHENIVSYYECKRNPQYFTNKERINNNKVIESIKAYQGTIFSFYNGIDLNTSI